MYIVGINAAFHDSSACILKDGMLIAAAEEERFTEVKHGKRPVPFSAYELPFNAVYYCLKEAGIHLKDVDHIAYSFDPWILLGEKSGDTDTLKLPLRPTAQQKENWTNEWDPLFLSAIVNAPEQLRDGYPDHLQDRYRHAGDLRARWHFVNHHLAHAASAFLVSPFSQAAVLTLDGRGEKATTSYHIGRGTDLQLIGQVNLPHSFGLLYERLTSYLGFLHSSDEYKVMALASYGKPVYVNEFRSLITLKQNGQYEISQAPLEDLFGPARIRNAAFTPRHFDIAHSMQVVLEESVLTLLDWFAEASGMENLCMAGGVALNCVMNARVRDRSRFKHIWVQPAAGDAGTALGAALWTDKTERGSLVKTFHMDHVYWGPQYTDEAIEEFLTWSKVPYRKLEHIARETAALLAQDRIIGWFQGRMEFGPRSLGARSILASPVHAGMQARLNEVKDREDFRPVAPAVMQEYASEWFEKCIQAPFMVFVYPVYSEKTAYIPAVTHIDRTARVQTVNAVQNPLYHELLDEFRKLTGVPVLINTSFNTRGKPIVCTPHDALACFFTSPFDALIMGSYLIEKQP